MRTEEEKELRELLAIQHRHANIEGWSYMYFDDGEFQCSICGCDFVRDSAKELNAKMYHYALKVFNESCSRAA